MARLNGKSAVVAATERPLAATIAERLVVAGASVTLAVAKGGSPQALSNVRCVELDTDSLTGWQSLYDETAEFQGPVEVAVHIAADPAAKPLAETSFAEFGAAASSVDFVFAGTRAAVLAMREAAGEDPARGAIVNVSSFAAQVGLARGGMLNAVAAGVWNLSRQVGIETGENGEFIRVNSIHRGPDAAQAKALGIDAGRVVDSAAAVADAVVYLASDAARLVTASDLVIDGGLSAGL